LIAHQILADSAVIDIPGKERTNCAFGSARLPFFDVNGATMNT